MLGLDDTRIVFWFSRDVPDAELHKFARAVVEQETFSWMRDYVYTFIYKGDRVGVVYEHAPSRSSSYTFVDGKWMSEYGVS